MKGGEDKEKGGKINMRNADNSNEREMKEREETKRC